MSLNRKEFVNEIVKDICKEYAFEGSVLAIQNELHVELVSYYSKIGYTHIIQCKDVEPTADCFIKIRRDIVFGLQRHILKFFKINS